MPHTNEEKVEVTEHANGTIKANGIQIFPPHTNEEMMRRIDEKSQNEEWGAWRFVSDMLDNPDEFDIYPTSKCYEQIYDFVVSQKKKVLSNLKKSIREEIEIKKDNVWGILCEMDTNIKSEKEYAGDVVDEILSLKSLE